MTLKIFLTADVHLGMQFAGYQPAVAGRLREARFEALQRCVALANEASCDLFVVAGDLFERTTVPREIIARAAEIFGQFNGKLVAVLPGNHDFLSPSSGGLWKVFGEKAGDNLLLLTEARSYLLNDFGIPAAIYAHPCFSKHSRETPLEGFSGREQQPAVRWHIGVAHGTLEGLAPDTEGLYYPLPRRLLEQSGLDLWLLGHLHRPYPAENGEERVFYPGTPEPDGFDCRHPGHAWILELTPEGGVNAQLQTTGQLRFRIWEEELENELAVEGLLNRLRHEDVTNQLVRLCLKGLIPPEMYRELPEQLAPLEAQALFWQSDYSELRKQFTRREIEESYPGGSFPHQLLSRLLEEEDSEALQIAYDLLRRAAR